MWYEIRNTLGNKLAQWLMKHIRCYCSTFYTCCKQYDPPMVKCMTDSFLESAEK